MALFNFGKKKEENKKSACCCGSAQPAIEEPKSCCCGAATTAQNTCCGEAIEGICFVKVLGAGCKTCHQQYEYAKAAIASMGLQVEVEYITDMEKVMAYGVMSMPALVVNEKVVSSGKLLKEADVVKLLSNL